MASETYPAGTDQKVNGHAVPSPVTAPFTHPLNLPPTDRGPLEGLRDDDPTNLDRPLLKATSARRDRLAEWGSDDPIAPPWWTSREARRRRKRQLQRAGARLAVNSLTLGWRGAWWPARGAWVTGWRFLRWVTALELHPHHGLQPAVTVDQATRLAHLWMEERRKRVAAVTAALVLAVGGTGATALLALVFGQWWWARWVFAAGMVAAPVAGYVGLLRAGRPTVVKPLGVRSREHVVPDLTIGMIANTLAQVVGGQTGKAITDNPHNVIQEGILQGEAQVFRCVLPGASSAAGIVQHEQRIASGLGRPVDCAIVELLPQVSAGHFDLWVLDRPALGGAPRPGPLAKARKTSWWGRIDVGRTRTGQHHTERLRGGAWFVGGKPESGKSTLAIIAAAHTVLDPYAHLILVNLKGSPDYAWCKRVAHKYISYSPEERPQVIREVHALLAWLLEECGRRNSFLTRLVERGEATGNAVTEELARKYPELRPLTVILDELHRMFDEGDNPAHEAFAELLAKVLKAVRSAAITVICVTQLAGTESIPGVTTKAARVRACLKVSEATSMRQILGDLGNGAFERFGLAGFPAGVAMLTTDEGSPIKVGGWFLEPHLADIGERAHRLRTDLDLLTGEAAGEAVDTGEPIDPADLLRHLLPIIGSTAPTGGPEDDRVAWLSELETVLGGRDEYRGRSAGWLAPELRSRGVRTVDVGRRRGFEDRPSGQRKEIGVTAPSVRDRLAELIDAT